MTTVLATVTVTQEFIKNGLRGCAFCPIALAVNSALPSGVVSMVDGDKISFYEGMRARPFCEVDTPRIASRFIEDFDQGRPVSPISFELEIPTGTTQ